MKTKFSVIVPVYNAERYLCSCLDSIVSQSCKDWEAILVDDGSNDNSGLICDKYAEKDSRFQVIHQQNCGVSCARNEALKIARGEYVCFLDSDDLWAVNVLKNVHKAIEKTDCDWIRLGFTRFYENENPPIVADEDNLIEVFSGKDAFEIGCRLISEVSFPTLNFYRRSRIGQCKFPNGIRFREDAIFCFEMASMIKDIAIINYPGYLRRKCLEGASSGNRHRSDSYLLYGALIDMLERSKVKFPDLSSWLFKDVTQWFERCPDRTPEDEKAVLEKLRVLYHYGIITLVNCKKTQITLRLLLYIKTGLTFFLFPKSKLII